ncbi:DUF6895 family protein [Kibdelosporangium phytohabitans]|uniref:DUF6895 domain-containing protein n=1 Tax=Kibdelosporangium phytohabitans TaxID=860235 RepID=A0A0N9HRL3_9PSEU|nr:hypothetical protein [Kibdelosporangium phytohabitans]ALG09834.1 hypothetical protein AOZ06_25660 [Kibdelosporangium phytohabitans]MBE1468778.1 hypothetical protein [Kibdelosporangium phytohabitans]
MTATVHLAYDVAAGALAWLHTHRELDVFEDNATVDINDPDNVYKSLGELALAGSMVLREGVAGTAEARAGRELLEFSWEQLRRGDLLYERQLRHALLTDPLELYVPYARSGYRHEELERIIAQGSASDSMIEVAPNRRLAVANAHRVLGVRRDDDLAAMFRQTWLGRTPQPWVLDWFTAYCMTHTVFHLTDWGAMPEQLPPDAAQYLHNWLPVWFEVWAEAGQWDLVGELLIVGACLPEPRCDRVEWELFASVQHPDGLVPRDSEPVVGDPRQRFHDHQHTALVATIAGTLALGRLLGQNG